MKLKKMHIYERRVKAIYFRPTLKVCIIIKALCGHVIKVIVLFSKQLCYFYFLEYSNERL